MVDLNGRELAGFIKERQAHQVASLKRSPHLLIIRDSDNPVIAKYVNLKIRYGEDIGIRTTDYLAKSTDDIRETILRANEDEDVDGIILQLPITDKSKTDELTTLIAPEKDVDGLGNIYSTQDSNNSETSNQAIRPIIYDSATATAINWLLTGYNIELRNRKIAIVGRGKLVGAPLYRMYKDSGYDVTLFHRGSDLTELQNYDIIITATGVPGLISSSMVRPGAVVVDAGTASEKGILKGDVADDIRARTNLAAITPKLGGVGPLTVSCLFDHVIQAANSNKL